MKVTVIGRPGKIRAHGSFMITTMRGSEKAPPLPKGVPPMPESKLLYLLYIAKKHWKKVADYLENPDDALIIEGFLNYDKEMKRMAIFTQSASTKVMERERREKQKAEAAALAAAEAAAAKLAEEAAAAKVAEEADAA